MQRNFISRQLDGFSRQQAVGEISDGFTEGCKTVCVSQYVSSSVPCVQCSRLTTAALQERDRRKDIAVQKALEVEGVQKAKLLLRRQSMVSLLSLYTIVYLWGNKVLLTLKVYWDGPTATDSAVMS